MKAFLDFNLFITKYVLIVLFLLGELFLRMFFEMLIGYFDMHDYLYEIYKTKYK